MRVTIMIKPQQLSKTCVYLDIVHIYIHIYIHITRQWRELNLISYLIYVRIHLYICVYIHKCIYVFTYTCNEIQDKGDKTQQLFNTHIFVNTYMCVRTYNKMRDKGVKPQHLSNMGIKPQQLSRIYVCVYLYMYACNLIIKCDSAHYPTYVYVCMHVCMCVYICLHIYIYK
jgi:hypothetical protein